MKKKYFILLVLFGIAILGCGKESHYSSPPDHITPTTLPFQEPEFFNKEGLKEVILYLKESSMAFEDSKLLRGLFFFYGSHYDWKKEKIYLKSHKKEDFLEKLLALFYYKYKIDESHKALIEILKNPSFLKKNVDFFTSEPFLTVKQKEEFLLAFKNQDFPKIQELLSQIHMNFFKYFDQYYHINSSWAEEQKEFIEGGLSQIEFIDLIGIPKEDSETELEKKSIFHEKMINFLIDLIKRYYSK